MSDSTESTLDVYLTTLLVLVAMGTVVVQIGPNRDTQEGEPITLGYCSFAHFKEWADKGKVPEGCSPVEEISGRYSYYYCSIPEGCGYLGWAGTYTFIRCRGPVQVYSDCRMYPRGTWMEFFYKWYLARKNTE